MTRRQYRTGSVHPHHSPDCPRPTNAKGKPTCKCPWRGTYEAGFTKDGGRRRRTVTGATEAEAKRRLAEKQLELARGQEVKGRTTVKAWADEWLRMVAKTNRPKTHVTDVGATKWIVGTIGHRRLADLDPGDIRAVRDAITDAGHSTSTALRYHGTLMRMLKAARDEGHDLAARTLAVKPPKKAINDRQAIPLEDSLALLSVAAEMPHGSRWVAALLQGMRRGECLGLTWPQVDLAAETLTISWQLQDLNYLDKHDRSKGFLVPDGFEARQLKGRKHLVRPKSDAGWRVIPLVPWMTQALAAWHAISPESPHGLVWPATDGGPAGFVDDIDEWHVIQETVGVRHPNGRLYTVHEARHATATLLLRLGIPESVRIAIMGHSSIASTTAYEHVDTSLARDALNRAAEQLQLTTKESA